MSSILISFLFIVTAPTLQQVRDLYQLSAENEKKCTELIRLLGSYNEDNNPLYMGYKASAVMMMAKHTVNPFSKLSWFNKGKKQLEKAISSSSQDVELRCLRFAAQSNIPAFLGYKDNLEDDKQFILSRYPSVTDPTLKKNIRYFMEKWGHLTREQKQLIQ